MFIFFYHGDMFCNFFFQEESKRLFFILIWPDFFRLIWPNFKTFDLFLPFFQGPVGRGDTSSLGKGHASMVMWPGQLSDSPMWQLKEGLSNPHGTRGVRSFYMSCSKKKIHFCNNAPDCDQAPARNLSAELNKKGKIQIIPSNFG